MKSEENKVKHISSETKNYLLTVLCVAGLAFLVCPTWKPFSLLINLTLLMPLTGILMLIPNKRIVCCIEGVLCFAVYYANEFVLVSRGNFIRYTDIVGVRTALMVANNYKPPFTLGIVIRFLLFAGWVAFICSRISKADFKGKQKVFIPVGISLTSVILICTLTKFTPIFLEEQTNYREWEYYNRLGFFYALYCEYVAEERASDPPEGYDDEYTKQLIAQNDKEVSTDKIVPQNIIVIMNEAFTDFEMIGNTNMSEDALALYHSISENCVKGELCVDVFGGNTCVTEFEALSGCPALYSLYSSPYSQAPLKGLESMVSDFNGQSWDTVGMHPFKAEGWHRNTVYPDLGFSKTIFGEQWDEDGYNENEGFKEGVVLREYKYFGDLQYYRNLVGDEECYKKIEDVIEETSDPLFAFCVTIQNHGGYTYDLDEAYLKQYISENTPERENRDFIKVEGVEGLVDKIETANEYLSLLHISDIAFDEFLNELKNIDEPTMVIMFGDHQPMISFEWYKDKYSDDGNEFEQVADYYKTPYIIWTNYDSDLSAPEQISANYLSLVIKQNAGLPMTAFDNIRNRAMQEYPVLTYNFAVNANGEYVDPKTALENPYMKDYQYVMYYRWMHKKNNEEGEEK